MCFVNEKLYEMLRRYSLIFPRQRCNMVKDILLQAFSFFGGLMFLNRPNQVWSGNSDSFEAKKPLSKSGQKTAPRRWRYSVLPAIEISKLCPLPAALPKRHASLKSLSKWSSEIQKGNFDLFVSLAPVISALIFGVQRNKCPCPP